MLLYLLFPAFILGVVGLPADNTTDGVHEEIIQFDGTLELLGNRTFNISLKDGNQLTELEGQLELQTNQILNITTEGDGAIKSNNETSSFYKDQLVELEEKWVLPANQTLNSTTQDEGSIKSSGDPSTTTNYEDQLIELEEKLGLPTNHTMNITTEDDERFQDQEQYHHPTHCNEQMLVEYSHMICGDKFHQSMLSYSKQHWCDFKYIIGKVMRKDKGGGDDGNDDDDGVEERLGPYNKMTYCMEQLSNMLGCYYPNPSVQDFFLYIHSQYFYNCSEEELQLSDAPHSVVVVLTLLPVSLIPILVFLVIWKSKVVEAEACGDVSVEACQGFIRHSRRFFQRCLERENVACDVDEALWPGSYRRCDS